MAIEVVDQISLSIFIDLEPVGRLAQHGEMSIPSLNWGSILVKDLIFRHKKRNPVSVPPKLVLLVGFSPRNISPQFSGGTTMRLSIVDSRIFRNDCLF